MSLAFVIVLCLGQNAPCRTLTYRLAEIGWQFQVRQSRFTLDSRLAGRDRERVGRLGLAYHDDWRRMVGRVEALIKANPGDPAGFQGVLLLTGPLGYTLDADIRWLVGKFYLDEPKLGRVYFDIRHRTHPNDSTWVRELIEQALGSPNRQVRGQATYALGDFCRRMAFREGNPPGEADKARYLTQAVGYLDKVLRAYPDAMTPDGRSPLAAKATVELARIRNNTDLKVGRPAPEIVGPDLDGQIRRLGDYRGQVVLLVFWQGTERRYGRSMLDNRDLLEVVRRLPCTVLGVSYDDGGSRFARETATREKFPGPLWWDVEYGGPIQSAYDVRDLPTTFLLDRRGMIRRINPKPDELAPAIRALAAEPEIPGGR